MPTATRARITDGSDGFAIPMLRYGLLRRLARSAAARGVTVIAFGLGDDELRVVLDGPLDARRNVLRGTKSGTCRAAVAWKVDLSWDDNQSHEVSEEGLPSAIAWCHGVYEGDPLATPWTSHRDLLGYREAGLLDAEPVRARVDPLEVHRLAGGGALPTESATVAEHGLHQLLRIAAAVVGVLPGNRQCFRLFVHLARAHGWRTKELSKALMLTGRRIRQLAQGEEPLLSLALVHVGDARLAHVP